MPEPNFHCTATRDASAARQRNSFHKLKGRQMRFSAMLEMGKRNAAPTEPGSFRAFCPAMAQARRCAEIRVPCRAANGATMNMSKSIRPTG